MNNVIQFPKGKYNAPPQSIDEMVDSIEKIRREHSDMIVAGMIPQLVDIFMSNGVDIDQHEYVKDFSMIVEASKSLLYKYFDIEHPFHNMIEQVFEFSYNDDDTVTYSYKLPTETEEE